MIINFRQGIISYPATGNLAVNQTFLSYSGGSVSLQISRGNVDIALAHGIEDYLYSETANVPNAWTYPNSTDVWLYWDIDAQSAIRTFGYTTVEPTFGVTQPTSPVEGLHWFNTTTNTMQWYHSNAWRTVIRVFAAKANNGVFSPLGSKSSAPFAGSQVNIASAGVAAGRIIFDIAGAPIRRTTGEFFTTEDNIFVQGSSVNSIRLEANVFTGTALESVSAYQIVKFTDFGQVRLASYVDTQNATLATCMQDLVVNQTGTLCAQGAITNPLWTWPTVGEALWISGTTPGALTNIDPHVADPVSFPTGYPPVARVLTPTSVIFNQGLGGKGERGAQGFAGTANANTVAITQYHDLTGTNVTLQMQQLYDRQAAMVANAVPLATKGDLLAYGTAPTRLPVGADTYVIVADSTQPLGVKWAPHTSALVYSDLLNDTWLGTGSLYSTPRSGGGNNTAVGYAALSQNTSGSGNTGIGAFTLQNSTTGANNSALGYGALLGNLGGTGNVAVGYNSGSAITTGNYNVILGSSPGSSIATLNNHIIISDGQGNERILIDNTGVVTVPGNTNVLNSTVYTNAWITVTGTNTGTGTNYSGGSSTAIDSTGNVFITGGTDPAGYTSIIKYSPTGTILWQRAYPDAFSGETIVIDHADNLIVTGPNTAGSTYSLMKVSSATGAITWQIDLDTVYYDSIGLAVDTNNDIIVGGHTIYTATGTNVLTPIPLWKVSSAGSIVWKRMINIPANSYPPIVGPNAHNAGIVDLTLDSANNIYLVGLAGFVNESNYGTTLALDPTATTILWEKDTTPTAFTYTGGWSYGVVAGATDVYVVGQVFETSGAFRPTVTKFNKTTGAQVWCIQTLDALYNGAAGNKPIPWAITIDPVTETVYVAMTPQAPTTVGGLVIWAVSSAGVSLWASTVTLSGYWSMPLDVGIRNITYRNGYLAVTGYTNTFGSVYDAITLHVPSDGSAVGPYTNSMFIHSTPIVATALATTNLTSGFTLGAVTTPATTTVTSTAPTVTTLLNDLGYLGTTVTLATDVITASQTVTSNSVISTLLSTPFIDVVGTNAAYGLLALSSNVSGVDSTAIGHNALHAATTGTQNTAVGSNTLDAVTTGSYNTGIGPGAGRFISTGSYNVVLGGSGGASIATLSNHIVISDGLGTERITVDNLGACNIVGSLSINGIPLGASLVGITAGSTTTYNTALGVGAITANTGTQNTAVGYNALLSNTTGFSNVAIGLNALTLNTGGYGNIGVGVGSLSATTGGSDNIGVGTSTLAAISTGIGNTAVGAAALQNTITSYNTAVGYNALINISGGTNNTALGPYAGSSITSGSYNVLIGGSNGATINGLSNHIILSDGQGNERIKIDGTGATTIAGPLTTTTETILAPFISLGTLTLDLSISNNFNVALNANITTLSLLGVAASGVMQGFTLIFTADGTARTVTWPLSFKWAGGTAPTLTSTLGKIDVFTFMTLDGGASWLAFAPGQNM